jgi:cell fate regulator YaaT (PSP1 superfamily)
MILSSKVSVDRYIKTGFIISKVNIRQYLTNRREPVEMISDIIPADQQSGVIQDASRGRESFRRLASSLRIGHKL